MRPSPPGSRPCPERFTGYVTSVNTSILIPTSLADPLIVVGLLVFLAGFRRVIRQVVYV
jgi:hypothetical protein